MTELIATPLDVIEIGNGAKFVFGGVYAANEGYFAEIHLQNNGKVRMIEKSSALPNREIAVAWMRERCETNAA